MTHTEAKKLNTEQTLSLLREFHCEAENILAHLTAIGTACKEEAVVSHA